MMLHSISTVAYDPDTGAFTRVNSARADLNGRAAGSVDTSGYLQIKIEGKAILAHRLAWRIVTGDWPKGDIDHINGDRLDNRLCNLREADDRQNAANRKTKGILPKGVVPFGKRFGAAIQYRENGRKMRTHLGMFDTLEQAHAAYAKAAAQRWGAFANLRKAG